MNKSLLIYGPQACGKTHHGAALARHFGLQSVVELDELDRQARRNLVPTGVLYLTNSQPPFVGFDRRALSFDEAMRQAGLSQRKAVRA